MNQNDFSLALLATESVSTVQSQAWPQSIPADNMSGFSALPGGRTYIGAYDFIGDEASFWLPEESSKTHAKLVYLKLNVNNNGYNYETGLKKVSYSVRCVRELDD